MIPAGGLGWEQVWNTASYPFFEAVTDLNGAVPGQVYIKPTDYVSSRCYMTSCMYLQCTTKTLDQIVSNITSVLVYNHTVADAQVQNYVPNCTHPYNLP